MGILGDATDWSVYSAENGRYFGMKEEMNMESRKELNTPSEEKEALHTATVELNDEELTQVSGGKVNQKIKKFNNPEVTND